MLSRARSLRSNPTPAEVRFWRLIYPLRSDGVHFRKQAPIGPFIVDFVCNSSRLIVEIDGDSHFDDSGIAADAARTAYLKGHGYRVLRFTNLEVMAQPEGVFAEVVSALGEREEHPLPASPI